MAEHPQTPEDLKMIALSHMGLRQFVGWLGLSLPVLLWLGSYAFPLQAGAGWGSSISAHYWAPHLGDLFVGTLCVIGFFLCFYQGYPHEPSAHHIGKGRWALADWLAGHVSDRMVTTVAGLGALVTALIPTPEPLAHCAAATDAAANLMRLVHWIGAAVFLGALAWLSVFHFTRTRLPPDRWPSGERAARWRERRIHVGLGLVMAGALAAILPVSWLGLGTCPAPGGYGSIFWLEAVAVAAFALSWLIKGESVLHSLAGLRR